MKIVTASNGKTTVKMSKSEWTELGKKAGWTKTAGLPQANNQQVAKLAQSINFLYSKLMPNLQQEVGAKAGDLIRAFDAAFAKQEQFEQTQSSQAPAQAQSTTLTRQPQ